MRKVLMATVTVMVIAMTALLVTVMATNRKSEKDLEEIDRFIAQYETESSNYITEKTYEKVIESSSAVNYRNDIGSSDHSDTGDEERVSEDPTEKVLSIEELAEVVLNAGINGDEREAYLGSRYEEVQNYIDENYTPNNIPNEPQAYPNGEGVLNPEDGINYYYGTLETYYNLDVSGVVEWMHSLGYEGDYWVREDGVKMFGPYVMVAAEYDQYPKGSIVETSLGTGMVCDTGEGGYDWFDIAVEW